MLRNVGTVIMSVTVLDRTRNGNIVSLLDQVDPIDMTPNTQKTITETEEINLCHDQVYKTTLRAKADPPSVKFVL